MGFICQSLAWSLGFLLWHSWCSSRQEFLSIYFIYFTTLLLYSVMSISSLNYAFVSSSLVWCTDIPFCVFEHCYIMVHVGWLQVSSICTSSIHDRCNISVSSGKDTWIHTLPWYWFRQMLIRTEKISEEESELHSNWWKYTYSREASICYAISRKRFGQGSSGMPVCIDMLVCIVYMNLFLVASWNC